LPRAVDQQPATRTRLGSGGECLAYTGLGLGPDSRNVREPAGGRRLTQLVGGVHVERPGDLDRALRAQPQVVAKPDQLRSELPFELRELSDAPCFDELV